MAVECAAELRAVGQERFHAIDRKIMGHAFAIHNSMGRFCDENIYQKELVERCRRDNMKVEREVHIRVVHFDFVKSYYLDILADSGAVYELKAVQSLNEMHEQQLINYLLLTGLKHGKLVNFGSASVEYRFVSTQLTRCRRMEYDLDWRQFDPRAGNGRKLSEILGQVVADWGAFLDVDLYRDAIRHFLSGSIHEMQSVDVVSGSRVVGQQKFDLVDADTAWHLSGVKCKPEAYEKHLKRLLTHTHLKRMHWINFNNHHIVVKTLKNDF